MRACTELAREHDCDGAARCGWKAVCKNGGPAGTGTCNVAASCQNEKCGPTTDFTCGCRCAAAMSPAHALTLLRVDACTLACNFDGPCITAKCSLPVRACLGE